MVEVPAAIPVTTPVDALIVATLVVTDFQTPPLVASDKVVVCPTHTVVVPVIDSIVGNGFTVTAISCTGRQVVPASGLTIAYT